jgi:hypothetical protein
MGDALGAIGRGFRPIFEEQGFDLVEVALGKPDAPAQLHKIVREAQIAFAFSFVGMAASLRGTTSEGMELNFWEALRIPYISLYGDTPAYFFDRHVMPTRMSACLYAFPEHVEFRKTLPHLPGILGTTLPGVIDSVPKSTLDFKAKERGRLLFLKNGNDPEQMVSEWRSCLPSRTFLMLADIAGELVARMSDENTERVDQVVDRYFRLRGIEIANAALLRLFFVAQLDDYLRRIKSTLMARVLMDFPVDMFGYNWDHLDFSGKRVNFTPGGDYTRSAPMIRDSLGVIDMSPNTSLAPHERPLRAFGAYTLCLTNQQAFFKEHVAHSGEFSFAFQEESFRSKIADVVAHPKRYVEIGIAAAESFRSAFPVQRFVEALADIAELLRLSSGARPGALQPYFAWPPESI